MTRHSLAILLLVVVVLSAGCASLISAGDSPSTADAPDSDPAPTTDSEQSNTSTTETDTSTSDSTATPTTDSEQSDASTTETDTSTPETNETSTAETNTSTTYSAWSEPEPPNLPLENEIEPERIPGVQFVNTKPGADGEGYADFDLRVTADTRMENVDPPDHGDVEGEPYFIVYVSETRFTQINNSQMRETRFARMDNLRMQENGTFDIRMNKRGLEQFERGQLNVRVRLLDEDSEWDDIYGEWTGTLEYNPE